MKSSVMGVEPQAFVDEVAEGFKTAWQTLNISHDYFFRTTNPAHEKIVQDILQRMYDAGLIYKGLYEGLYCVGCERYLSPEDIVDGKCPLHPTVILEERKEENYFLKLTQLAPDVLAALERDEYRVLPPEKKNEIVAKVKGGIKDISISRAAVEWGVRVPWDETHTVYVWIDALFNYYSATKIAPGRERFWPADLHLLAKDILWFHAFVWEALLRAADISLPKVVFAHGFFTIDGQKMSKSVGNVIDPNELVATYGVDGARYLLLTAFAFGNDGDITLSKFDEKYNADLANGIGNLVSRIAKLCESAELGGFPESSAPEADTRIADAFTRFRPDEALDIAWGGVRELDRQINADEPWKLEGKERADALARYVFRLLGVSRDIAPFLPETARCITDIFTAKKIVKPDSLFSRRETRHA
jgi:methionyl-tRNA synthetase